MHNSHHPLSLAKKWLFQQRKHSRESIIVNRQELKLNISGIHTFTFTASGLTDSISIWSGHVNDPNWDYVDGIDPSSGKYTFDSQILSDHPYCLLKFIAHDSAGYAIGKDFTDTLFIDNEGNGRPNIMFVDDYFYNHSNISKDQHIMSVLLADPESDPLHITFSVSYDNGINFETYAESEVEVGIFEQTIALNQLSYSDSMVIRAEVRDGEYSDMVQTLFFENMNGLTSTESV